MHTRTMLLVVAIIGVVLLTVGGTMGAVALTRSGFLGNNGNGMMNGQPSNGPMGGSQQGPGQQGTPGTVTTHPTIDIVINQPGMQKDWPAFSPSNLVVPAHSLVTITIRDHDLGDTGLPQDSPFTTVQGTVGTSATADGRTYASLASEKIAHTFTLTPLNVNVPLPGDARKSKDFNTVTFTFRTGGAGTFTFRCFVPCGTGPMGMMGPMVTYGYMLGTLTVQ